MEEKNRGTPNPLSPSIDATLLDANPSETLDDAISEVGLKNKESTTPEAKHTAITESIRGGHESPELGANLDKMPEVGPGAKPEVSADGWLNVAAGPDLAPKGRFEISSEEQLDADIIGQSKVDATAKSLDTNQAVSEKRGDDRIPDSTQRGGAETDTVRQDASASTESGLPGGTDLIGAAAKASTTIPVTAPVPPALKPTMIQDILPPAGSRLVDPMIAARPRPSRPDRPGTEQTNTVAQPTTDTASAQPMGIVTSIDGSVSDQGQSDPASRPMKQMVLTETPKPEKKNIGLIIGVIISLFVAIGCGVAALLLFLNPASSDLVAKAVLKLANEGAPENVKINGSIDTSIDAADLPITDVRVSLNSELMPKSLINSSTAKINIDLSGSSGLDMELSEVYAANGELFMKVDGLKDLTNALSASADDSSNGSPQSNVIDGVQEESRTTEKTDCVEGSEQTDCVAEVTENKEEQASLREAVLNLTEGLSTIDGGWIRFSNSEMGEILSASPAELNPMFCSAKLLTDASSDNNTLSQAYIDSPFILSSSENVPIRGKDYTAYAMLVDEDNLREFLNRTSGSQAMRNFASCMGYGNLTSGGADEFIADIKKLPQIYLEINEEYNITRVYFASKNEIPSECNCYEDGVNCNEACVKDGEYELVVDLNLSYPANVNIPKPAEYTDFSKLDIQLEQKTQANTEPVEDNK